MSFNFSTGLTSNTYRQNVLTYGLNKLPQKKPVSGLEVLWNQFRSPLIYILCGAAILTLALGDLPEAAGIALVILLNTSLGFFQEYKAEKILEDLRSEIKPQTAVIREGREITVLTSDITVGDVVVLRMGDKIPSDGIVISADRLSANESPLTGEAEPVGKYAASSNILSAVKHNGFVDESVYQQLPENNQVYMGSTVASGVGQMLVTHIGEAAKFGQILASLANEPEVDTPLQLKVKTLSRDITLVVAAVSLFLLGYGFWQGHSLLEVLELTISIAVSAIPEGLAIALTIILALSMSKILKKKALVRELVAAESLGSVDTICIDKTGTLTLGEMQVVDVQTENLEMFKRTIFATNQQINAVELSLMHWLKKHLTHKEQVDFAEEQIFEHKPFNSSDKYSAAQGTKHIYVVGAPELLLAQTTMSQKEKSLWQAEFDSLTNKGLRLVGLAFRKSNYQQHIDLNHLPEKLTWIGLAIIDDPIRPNLKSTFQAAATAGISIKVITGDVLNTAMAVLQKAGIQVMPAETMSGAELGELSENALLEKVESIRLFYRTSPQQKLDIVKALQAKGHVVAMMGDGINDTPALKRAEIGIVVENATSFSKEVADMILLDSNFKTIIDAVEEGRNIFEKVQKVVAYLLMDAFDAVILVLGALLLGLPSPLYPLQILYINLVADGLPDLALAFEPADSDLMRQPPKPKNTPIIDARSRTIIALVGFLIMGGILLGYKALYSENDPLFTGQLQTAIFAIVGLNSLLYVFSIRTFRVNIWKQNFFNNKLLLAGVFFGIIFVVAAIYTPFLQAYLHTVALPASFWVGILGVVTVDIILFEIVKYIFIKFERKI